MATKLRNIFRSKSENTLLHEKYIGREVCVSMSALHAFTHVCGKQYIKCSIQQINRDFAMVIIDENVLLRAHCHNIKILTEKLMEQVCDGKCTVDD